MKFIASILLLAALGASPGCRSLGSHEADAARASDVGATVGAAATAIPGAGAALVAVSPLTELAAREAQRRIDATPAGEPLGLLTEILIGIGALGGIFTAGKSAVRTVVAKAVEAARPSPPA